MALSKLTDIRKSLSVEVEDLKVNGITTFTGNVSIGGTLTYQDVTNVDSVGVITARSTIDAQGAINLADSIIHTGDTNTKIRFPAADTVTIETAGSERLRITSAGSVGINETSPDRKLHVRSDGAAAAKLGGESGSAYYMEIGQLASSGSPGFNATGSSTSMLFQLNGTEKVRIDSSGRLLVATNSASAANSGADDLVIGNTSQGNNGMSIVTNNANIGGIFFADQDNTVRGGVRYQHASDLAQFYAGGSVVLNLKNKGVGINETSPASDALIIRGGDTDDTPSLILKRATDGTQSSGEIIGKLQFTTNENNVDSGNYQPRVEIQGEITDTVGGAAMALYTAAGSATSPTERLRIDSSGNVNFQNSSTDATTALSTIIFNNGVGEVARIRSHTRNGNNYGMITFHNHVNGTSAEKFRLNHDGGFCYGTDSSRTAEFSQPDGFSIRFDDKGQFQNSVTNTTGGYMNRKGSDGGILSFARQGTYVGEIGVNSSTIFLNFGGTNAAAHQLDDYEEGTWTPAIAFDVGGGGITYGNRAGSYVKIGRMVHLQYYMVISSGVSSSDYFARLALPFTGISVQHQDARIRQWNTGVSDWFVSLGGSNPVFFKNNSVGGGGTWARGDSINGQVLSGQYVLYV